MTYPILRPGEGKEGKTTAAAKIMARKTARTGRAGQRVANKPAGS
jgi:hypothetical protein